ncbi:hypothetical protein DV736_g2584, partial [Chaetothyriales sp. CBS 134916]
MSSPRSSTSSSAPSTSQLRPTEHKVSSICIPKGKWYDCLRPTTTPYQGFGGMAGFNLNNYDDRAAGTEESWTEDIREKMK